MTSESFYGKFPDRKKTGSGFSAKCPAHEDHNASLSLGEGDSGRFLLHCHAGCSVEQICASLEIKPADLFPSRNGHNAREIVASYDYVDEAGKLLFQVCRYHPKDFRQRAPDGRGGWLPTTKGVRRVLYRLPEVLVAIQRGERIFIVEGEKDVAALEKHGFTATCNAGGAAGENDKSKWLPSYSESLRGADVVIIPDNDEPGRTHANVVASRIRSSVSSVKICPLPHGKDVHDFFSVGGTGEQIQALTIANPPPSFLLGELPKPESNSGFLGVNGRLLFAGAGAIVAAQTGSGKSTWTAQCSILWSIGKPAFGIAPLRPLKSLIIQAENDYAEMIEMREKLFLGLGLFEEQQKLACENVRICCEDSRMGESFLRGIVEPLLEAHKPDLLWIDPLLAYLGGNVSEQEVVSVFLRNHLNPIIKKHGCACIIIHHTGKPRRDDRAQPLLDDDYGYLAAGSAELVNWPRAAFALTAVTPGTYRLTIGKRGNRAGWTDQNGRPTKAKFIAHAAYPEIYWKEVELAPGDSMPSSKSKDPNMLLPTIPIEGYILRSALENKAREEPFRFSVRDAKHAVDVLIDRNQAFIWKIARENARPAIGISRYPQPKTAEAQTEK